ncbi:MAG: histidine phosphatase family protein [Pseudomonadota bacterium]
MRRLWLRHPRPAVRPGTCYGRLDVAEGQGAAAETAAALTATPVTTLVLASPARRCRRLAERLAARDGVPLRFDPRLLELDFGRWEGRAWDAIPRSESDPWAEDPWHRAPPGGERFADLYDRVAAALDAAPCGTALVCHAGPIRAARMILGGETFEAAFARPVPYATPLELSSEPA